MLPLEQCYEIDLSLKSLSKEEVFEIHDQLYKLGELAVDNFIKKNSNYHDNYQEWKNKIK